MKGGDSLSGEAFKYLADLFDDIATKLSEMWGYLQDITSAIAKMTFDAAL